MLFSRRVLILGARGRLGAAVARRLAARHTVLAPTHGEFDLSQGRDAVRERLRGLEFDVLINCAGITSPEACVADPAAAWAVNAEAVGVMAMVCRERDARLIHLSTDYVFPGDGGDVLREEAPVGPLSLYGETKLAGEQAVLATDPKALVARVSWLFGPDKAGFPDMILEQARRGEAVAAIADKWSTPTFTEDLAHWLEALCLEHVEVSGLLHLCNAGAATWQEYAQTTADLAHEMGVLAERVEVAAQALEGFPHFRARRPRFTPMSPALFTERTGVVPDGWHGALRRFLAIKYGQVGRAGAK